MGLYSKDMSETELKAVKVDQKRLMDTLHYTCGFGTGLRWGRYELDTLRISNVVD